MRIGGIALIILLKIEGYVTYTLIRRMCELLGRSKSLPVFAYLMPLFSIYYSYKGPIGDHLFVRSPMRMWYVHEVFFKKQRLELCLLSKKLIFTRLSEPVRPYTRQITIKWRKRGGGGEDAIEGVRLKHLWLVLGIQLWTCDVENEAKLGCYLAGTGKIGNWRTDKPKQLVNQTQRFFF